MTEPDDVLEQGPHRPRRWPTLAAAAVAIAGLALLAVLRLGGDDDGEPVSRESSTPPAPPPATSWPTAAAACGEIEVPLTKAVSRDTSSGLHVVMGGRQLVRADVDTGRKRIRVDLAASRRWVQKLVRHGGDVYAQTAPCGLGDVRILRDTGHGSVRPVDFSGPVDELIGGPAGVWGVSDPKDGDNGRVVLRGVDGHDLRLARGLAPVGVTAEGIVASTRHTMYLVDPATGRVARTIGRGDVRAVGAHAVAWTGTDCRFTPGHATTPVPRRSCALHVTRLDVDHDSVTYPLPDNRLLAGPVVFGPGDRAVAFQLSRPRHELHYADRHPWTPSQVAVLDLTGARLRTVPGLTLPAKTTAGMVFSADGDWLAVTANLGDHGELLAWQRGSAELVRTPVTLAGPLAYEIPVLVDG